MAYIVRHDLERRFGVDEIAQLLDDDGSGTESASETDSLTHAISDAEGIVNGYIAVRYSLPLAAVPDMVKGWACDIARFRLWDEQAPEEVRRRYEDAIGQLRDLAKGLLSLPPGADGAPAGTGLQWAGYGNERVFTADTLAGF